MRRIVRMFFVCAVAAFGLASVAFCDEAKVIVVKDAEGRGKSRQLALTDAFRAAISKALGSYVVSMRKLEGETLDKKIFDNSDAVVKSHKVVYDKEELPGKWKVIIDAEIIPNKMIQYIQKKASVKVGEGELANLLVKKRAIDDAVGSLELLFQNWRENTYRAEKYGQFSVSAMDSAGDETIQIAVPFIMTLRWGNYDVLLEKVRNALSRIAIDKTKGVYDAKKCRYNDDFVELNYDFYNKVGLLRKNEYDFIRDTGNPNRYREVRILSNRANDQVVYEVYVVPNQIGEALEKILQEEAEIQFLFTSKGGRTIATSAIEAELSSWETDQGNGINRLVLRDWIYARIRGCNSDSGSTMQKVYRATVPVPLAEASQIVGCNITVRLKDKERDYARTLVTAEAIAANEWLKLDKKPNMAAPVVKKPPVKTVESPSADEEKKPSPVAVAATPTPTVAAPLQVEGPAVVEISKKDKKLKKQALAICRMPLEYSTAGRWFALSKEIESDELRQVVLKASGAALLASGKADVYASKVRPLLDDAESFRSAFNVQCSKCGGDGVLEEKCKACSGTGRCKNSACRNGRRLVHRLNGGSYWGLCGDCKGSMRCAKCNATGKKSSRCIRCNGKGITLSQSAVSAAYRNYVKTISQSFKEEK